MNRRGFTLLELIVSIALIGLLIGLVFSGANQLLDRDFKRAANRLAATIRFLYNKAAMDGSYFRLVIDLDERSYWVEATSDPFLLGSAAELSKKVEKKEEGASEKDDESKKEEGDLPKVEKIEPRQPKFTQFTEHLLKPTRLPETVFFKDIFVEHEPTPIEGGKVSIAFFPNGYVEASVINLRDEDDEVHYSLRINSVSGVVEVLDSYQRLEEEK